MKKLALIIVALIVVEVIILNALMSVPVQMERGYSDVRYQFGAIVSDKLMEGSWHE